MFKLPYGEHGGLGQGGFIASDLTGYGANHTASAIKQAIVQPDTPLDPASRVVEVQTKTGQKLIGVVRSEDNFNLALQTEDGRYHFLTRSSLAEVNYKQYSLMPRDYGTRLTSKELDDLVSFLIVTGKNAPMEDLPPRRKRHGDRPTSQPVRSTRLKAARGRMTRLAKIGFGLAAASCLLLAVERRGGGGRGAAGCEGQRSGDDWRYRPYRRAAERPGADGHRG